MVAVAAPVFKVVTQFAFEEAALASAGQLEKKIEGISGAADEAVRSVASLGTSFLFQFTGAGGGIIGVLMQALKVADQFKQSQLDLAGIFSANAKMTQGARSFNDQLTLSKNILKDISNFAFKFGLEESPMVDTVKMLASTVLPKSKKGADMGNVMENITSLVGKGQMAGTGIGLSPGDMGFFINSVIEKTVHGQSVIFQRMMAKAPGMFAKHGVTAAADINNIEDINKRIKLLDDVFGKFSKNLGLAEMRAKTWTGLMTKMKNLFMGYNSVLMDLGDAFGKILIPLLDSAVNWIHTKGRMVLGALGDILGEVGKDVEKLTVNLISFSKASKNIGTTGTITGIAVILATLGPFLRGLGGILGKLGLFTGVQKFLLFFVGALTKIASFVFSFKFLGLILFGLTKILIQFVPLWGLLFVLFQSFTKALVMMKAETIKAIGGVENLDKVIARIWRTIKNVAMPINMLIDDVAQGMFLGMKTLVDAITGTTSKLDTLTGMLRALDQMVVFFVTVIFWMRAFALQLLHIGEVIKTVLSSIDANPIMMMIKQLKGLEQIGTINEKYEKMDKALMDDLGETIHKILYGDAKDKEVKEAKIEVQSVNVNQEFKDQISPDRVAFSVVDVLSQLSQNKTQGKGDFEARNMRRLRGVN